MTPNVSTCSTWPASTMRPERHEARPALRGSRLKPVIQQVLDAITEAAADVRNERGDIVASNKLGYALYSEIHAETVQPPNVARYTFLNPSARDFFVDWDRAATDVVAVLRATVGRNPYDKSLSDLVGELSTRSDEFRVRWAAHNVRRHTSGSKRMRHPVIGEIELNYQSFELPGEPGLAIQRVHRRTRHPEPASPAIPCQLGRHQWGTKGPDSVRES